VNDLLIYIPKKSPFSGDFFIYYYGVRIYYQLILKNKGYVVKK